MTANAGGTVSEAQQGGVFIAVCNTLQFTALDEFKTQDSVAITINYNPNLFGTDAKYRHVKISRR